MSSGRSLPQINLGVQGGIQGDSHNDKTVTCLVLKSFVEAKLINKVDSIVTVKALAVYISSSRWSGTAKQKPINLIPDSYSVFSVLQNY
ncbi:hypothetical protein TNCV_2090091 [Trichonephila clavipes]|nr:hypothetical protein TNCV_2090091 [Trichonephila clavipes]